MPLIVRSYLVPRHTSRIVSMQTKSDECGISPNPIMILSPGR